MTRERKYLKSSNHPHPHIGKWIKAVLVEKRIKPSELAKRLGITFSTVNNYFKHQSVQFGILWNVGIAIEYDFLSELCNYYPPNLSRNEKSALVQEILNLQTKLAEAEKTCSIYKEIAMR